MTAWCYTHRILLAGVSVVLTITYFIIAAVISEETAQTIGLGYLLIVGTLMILSDLAKRKHGNGRRASG
jgi:hypothetical protein